MKTPKELNKIYDKLPKDKVELAKVELGIVDDLGKLMTKLEKSNVDEKEYQKVIKAVSYTHLTLPTKRIV